MEYKLLKSIYYDYEHFVKIIFAKLKNVSNNINNIITNHKYFYTLDKYNKLNILHKEYSEEYIKIINEQLYIKDLLNSINDIESNEYNENINNNEIEEEIIAKDINIKVLLQKVKEIEQFLYNHNERK